MLGTQAICQGGCARLWVLTCAAALHLSRGRRGDLLGSCWNKRNRGIAQFNKYKECSEHTQSMFRHQLTGWHPAACVQPLGMELVTPGLLARRQRDGRATKHMQLALGEWRSCAGHVHATRALRPFTLFFRLHACTGMHRYTLHLSFCLHARTAMLCWWSRLVVAGGQACRQGRSRLA